MGRVLRVSTECPSCGGAVEYTEGTNALACGYCGNRHLVTGRRRVLAYRLSPPGTAPERLASFYPRRHRCFVPYYRFAAHDLRWELRSRLERSCVESESGFPEPGQEADRREGFFEELRDRYVEKSFLARPELGRVLPPSLGVRTSVLPARPLLDDPALREAGFLLPTLGLGEARKRAEETPVLDGRILLRRLLAARLAVVYHPFDFHCEEDGTVRYVVDAVSGSGKSVESELDVPATESGPPSFETAGLRPLLCPECGWELPFRPEDVVFLCGTCHRAWLALGGEFHRLSYEVLGYGAGEPVGHLPFWVFERSGTRTRLYVPAFRYRRLKLLFQLARELSVRAPDFVPVNSLPRPLGGCHYDAEDALALAQVVYPATKPDVAAGIRELSELSLSPPRLAWLPVFGNASLLRSPATGRVLYPALIG
ncbi:MAG: hypothetical protein KatS3mg076_2456 [Candidatus Binatia bacterium]|nr:MAG: hypothetical protein KatS3mg076_2456 [Candidatus Binatia bacterium]